MGRLTLTQRIRGLRRLSHTARRDVLRAQVALLRAQLTVPQREGALGPHVALEHGRGASGMRDGTRARCCAYEHVIALVERHCARHQPLPQGVWQDHRAVTLEDRRQRVSRPEVDADQRRPGRNSHCTAFLA